ncbi:MAG: CDP-alcohol phosphatidyltransferase family protein [Gammaproteobacteria bacterium]
MKHLPNIISVLRILLVIPIVNYLWHNEFGKALALFFIAGISDGLDGFLARHFGWMSRLGSVLDPLADKLLMTAIYFTLGLKSQLPLWLVALVIGRDLVIVLGAAAYRLLIKNITMQHLLISKLNTGMQILLVLLLIFRLSELPFANVVPSTLVTVLIYLVALTTLISGVAYVVLWSVRAREQLKVKSQ